jgi:hypothetical protein
MRGEQGRDIVAGMIARGDLERVPASRDHADVLVSQARRHLASAAVIADADPAGAYQLLYDAARKALVAVLENQGGRRWVSRVDPVAGRVTRIVPAAIGAGPAVAAF